MGCFLPRKAPRGHTYAESVNSSPDCQGAPCLEEGLLELPASQRGVSLSGLPLGSSSISQDDKNIQKPKPAGRWKMGQESSANYLNYGKKKKKKECFGTLSRAYSGKKKTLLFFPSLETKAVGMFPSIEPKLGWLLRKKVRNWASGGLIWSANVFCLPCP